MFNAYSGKTANLKNKQIGGTSAKTPLRQKKKDGERASASGLLLEGGRGEVWKATPLFLGFSQKLRAASSKVLKAFSLSFL